MGLICCSHDTNNNDYYNYDKKFKKCIKCDDNYDVKKNCVRTHCRYHRPNINDICIDCKRNVKLTGKNCYHIQKITFYDRLFN
jgi:hypothetical protein